MPAGDERHVVVVLGVDRTRRGGSFELSRRGSFASTDRGRGVVKVVRWTRRTPVIKPGGQTIEGVLLSIKAGCVCIQGRDDGG